MAAWRKRPLMMKMKYSHSYFLLPLMFALLACGSGGGITPRGDGGLAADGGMVTDGGPAGDGGVPNRSDLAVLDMGTHTLSQSGQVGLTPQITFTLPQDILSLVLIVHGQEGATYQLHNLTSPEGFVFNGETVCDMSLFGLFNGPNRTMQMENVAAFLLPNTDIDLVGQKFKGGLYRVQVTGVKQQGSSMVAATGTVGLEAIYRTGSQSLSAGDFDLNIFFTGAGGITAANGATSSKIITALENLRSIFGQVSIAVRDVRYYDAPPQYATINTITGASNDYSNMLKYSSGKPDGINLFLVNEIKSPIGGAGSILGMAGGIPGPPNRHGTGRSGIAVVADPVAGGPSRGQVWAHEIGHYLGLFHSTEFVAQYMTCAHDPLIDTQENDTNNLMYYTGGNGHNLTAGQGKVMRANPVVRPVARNKRGNASPATKAKDLGREKTYGPLELLLGDFDQNYPKTMIIKWGGASALRRAALDPSLDLYRRERAISFLEYFPTAETRAFLTQLIWSKAPNGLRRSAVFSLAFAYGRNLESEVLRIFKAILQKAGARIREAVVRGLSYLGSREAKNLLRNHLEREPDTQVRRAILRWPGSRP